MSELPQYRRLLWIRWGTCLLLALLIFRLIDLQVLQQDHLVALALQNTERAIVKNPNRGQIRDIRGNPLATTVILKRIYGDPSIIGAHLNEVTAILAPILKTNQESLALRLTPKVHYASGALVTNSYVPLASDVPVEVWQQAQAAMTNFTFKSAGPKYTSAENRVIEAIRHRAIGCDDQPTRNYPNNALAAHVIGYAHRNDRDELVGYGGVESTFNTQLTGVRGWRKTEFDNRRHEVVPFRNQDVDAVDGLNVIMTIDSELQFIVEQELAAAMQQYTPQSVSCTMVRPKTGEILAMATLPNFDPNHYGHFPPEYLKNRVTSEVAEPGSTFKIVVISAAINDGVARMTDVIDCGHGLFIYAGTRLHDHGSHGLLNLAGIIAKSSNIGAAKVGIELGPQRLSDYIQLYGFGQKTGITLPAEERGIVSVRDWTKVSIAQIPMGQGIAVTPLQMVMAMAAIANHGRLMQPMIVNRLEDPNGHVVAQYQPRVVRQILTETTVTQMVEALKGVVGPDGTASTARLENYSVAGKTGTAQKARPGGYYTDRYFSSFIGFFPADNPELVISVVMDDPHGAHFGSQVAAPVFKRIAQRAANYLNLPPDVQPIPQIRGTLATGAVRGSATRSTHEH